MASDRDERRGMGTAGGMLIGIVIGAVGAAAAFLMSDKKTREKVKDKAQELREKGEKAFSELRQRAEEEKEEAEKEIEKVKRESKERSRK